MHLLLLNSIHCCSDDPVPRKLARPKRTLGVRPARKSKKAKKEKPPPPAKKKSTLRPAQSNYAAPNVVTCFCAPQLNSAHVTRALQLDATDAQNATALHYAVGASSAGGFENEKIITFLLGKGAKADYPSKETGARALAIKLGLTATAQLLQVRISKVAIFKYLQLHF